jgi:predicted RNase H-like HicB family nuclease
MKLPVIVSKELKYYVALAPDVDIASQGVTIEEALENLHEALELYFEDEDSITPLLTNQKLITFLEVGN